MIQALYNSWATALAGLPISVYPADYEGPISTPDNFIKFSLVVPNANRISSDGDTVMSGLAVFMIYTPNGDGPKDAIANSQILETNLAGQTLSGGVQVMTGALQYQGKDPSDQALQRHDYSLSFLFHGEI